MGYRYLLAQIAVFVLVIYPLCGCMVVSTPYPVGDTLSPKIEKALTGVWGVQNEDQGILLIVFDNNGMGHIASPEWDSKTKKYIFDNEASFMTTMLDDQIYLSAIIKNVRPTRYQLALLKPVKYLNDAYHLCPANPNTFNVLIENNLIQGEVNSTHTHMIIFSVKEVTVHITSSRDDLHQLLISNTDKELFTCNEEVILQRISDISVEIVSSETEVPAMEGTSYRTFEDC